MAAPPPGFRIEGQHDAVLGERARHRADRVLRRLRARVLRPRALLRLEGPRVTPPRFRAGRHDRLAARLYRLPLDQVDVSGRFWSAALGWPLGEPWPERPEFRRLRARRTATRTCTSRSAITSPRVHLDLEVDDQAAAAERLIALGATPAGPPRSWRPLTSPGGFPFCLVTARPTRSRPAPLGGPAGAPAGAGLPRLPRRSLHDREVDFWRAALDWRWARRHPEFAGKLYPAARLDHPAAVSAAGAPTTRPPRSGPISIWAPIIERPMPRGCRRWARSTSCDGDGLDHPARSRRDAVLRDRQLAGRRR